MKTFTFLLILLAVGCQLVQAQAVKPTPKQPTYADSVGRPTPPVLPMGTEFYRKAGDPENVVSAQLDNMPIKTPDSSQQYKMLNPHQRYHTPPTSSLDQALPNGNHFRFKFKRQKP